jgi:hypothetical protein
MKVFVVGVAVSVTSVAVIVPLAVISHAQDNQRGGNGSSSSSGALSSTPSPFDTPTSSRSSTPAPGTPVGSPSPFDVTTDEPSGTTPDSPSASPSPGESPSAVVSSAPQSLGLTETAGNWADIAWSAPTASGTQPLAGYALFASVDGGANWILSGTVSPEQLSYRYGALQSNTSYLFAAQALTDAGASEFSNSTDYATPVFSPGEVLNLALGGHGCGAEVCGGEVSITPPTDAGLGTMFYEVAYSVDEGITWTYVSAEAIPVDSYNLQFLTGSLTFEQQNNLLIAVRASTEYGVGPLSAPLRFQYVLRSETQPDQAQPS